MNEEQKQQIFKLLSEIGAEAGMCCSTTMDPEYVQGLIEKIEIVLKNE